MNIRLLRIFFVVLTALSALGGLPSAVAAPTTAAYQKAAIIFLLKNSRLGQRLTEDLFARHLIANHEAQDAIQFILYGTDPVASTLNAKLKKAIDGIPSPSLYAKAGKISPIEKNRLRLASEELNLVSNDSSESDKIRLQAQNLVLHSTLPLYEKSLIPFLEIENQEVDERDYDQYLTATLLILQSLKTDFKIIEADDDDPYWKIEILGNEHSTLNKLVHRYLESHPVDHFYFDPRSASQASYTAANRSVRTGRPEVLFMTAVGQATLRHEGLHALLTALQNQGYNSIYSSQFKSMDPLSVKGKYSSYFSAQELATMSSDLRQIAILLKQTREPEALAQLMERIDHKIDYLQLIARQIKAQIKATDRQKRLSISYKKVETSYRIVIAVDTMNKITLPFLYDAKPSKIVARQQAKKVFTQLYRIADKVDREMGDLSRAALEPVPDYDKIADLASQSFYTVRPATSESVRSLLDLNQSLTGPGMIEPECESLFRYGNAE